MRDHSANRKQAKESKNRCNAIHRKRSSKKERREDALALRAEERRDKLRKAVGRSKYLLIHRYLNGETRLRKPQSPLTEFIG